jgi:hypothetical protein
MMPIERRGIKTEKHIIDPQRQRFPWRKINRGKPSCGIKEGRVYAMLRNIKQMTGIIDKPPVLQNMVIQYPEKKNRHEKGKEGGGYPSPTQ